uniref:Ig-like domain-containing protein n=1 Tax=Xiphophorus maculatus TaxID=8083 RepID=A0A3B5R2T2_XIPMA
NRRIHWIIFYLHVLFSFTSSALQQPDSLTVQPGQSLTVSCQVSYSVSTWIRQPAGKGLEWIGEAVGSSTDYKDSLRNKFSISTESSSNTVTLKGQNLQPEDTAVYYCARLHSEAKHEQTCTKTHSVFEHLKYCKPPEEAPSDHKLFTSNLFHTYISFLLSLLILCKVVSSLLLFFFMCVFLYAKRRSILSFFLYI